MADRLPSYKDLTYRQLRSFCEAVRLGSMRAAAVALDVSQPTVWQQIRGLEMQLGVALVESHARGCRPTAAGQALLRLAAPLVGEIESLPNRLRSALGQDRRQLTLAVTPRTSEEELPPVFAAYEKQFPQVRLTLQQVVDRDVFGAVTSGAADLGLLPATAAAVPEGLVIEPCYELEPILVVPRGHPLAKAKEIRPEQIANYPLLNDPKSQLPRPVLEMLHGVAAFDNPDRRIQLHLARSIRHYVKLGFGIGIVGRPSNVAPAKDVVERSIRDLVGSAWWMNIMYRDRVVPDAEILGFVDVLRKQLAS